MIAVGVLFTAWAFRPSLDNYNPQSAYGDNKISIEQSFSAQCNTDDVDCEIAMSEIEREKWLAERSDLASQWAMSDMAHMGFWAGLIGITFVFITLIETQKAARSAKSATEAAWVAANSDRAWLLHTMDGDGKTPQYDFEYSGLYNFENGEGEVSIVNGAWAKISIQNFGRSPARMIGHSVACEVVNIDEKVPNFGNTPFYESGSFIPPGGVYFSPKIPISYTDKIEFIKLRKAWFIYFKIVYKTIGDDSEKVSEFCFQFKALKHNVDDRTDRFLLENIIYVPRGLQNNIT